MPDTGYTILLADSTEYPVDWCGASGDLLAIQIKTTELDLLNAATIFSDTNATSMITFRYGEMQTEYVGYTTPIMVHDMRGQGGGVLVQLRKEAV